jgi:RNA polymerase sigma-70 factor (ECF subfamily)
MKKTLILTWFIAVTSGLTFAQEVPEISIESLPPSVVKTVPQAGDTSVDPSLKDIRVTFSKDMMTDRMWSFCQISDSTFPKRPEGKEISYLADKRTCVMPVSLEPGKTYVIWINRGQFNSFRDTTRRPAIPYLLVFQTRTTP